MLDLLMYYYDSKNCEAIKKSFFRVLGTLHAVLTQKYSFRKYTKNTRSHFVFPLLWFIGMYT